MKNLFKEAHEMTRKMMEQYDDIDYSAQFSLCLEFLKEREEEKMWRETAFYGSMMYGLSKKQAGVIFAAYKKGNLKVSEEYIKYMYSEIVDKKYLRNNTWIEDRFRVHKMAISLIFKGYYKRAAEDLMRVFNNDFSYHKTLEKAC